MAVTFNLDGQAYSFPDWATESTQEQIKKILETMAKENGVSSATLKKLQSSTDDMVDLLKDENKETKKRDEDQQKRDQKALKTAQELGSNMKDFSKEMQSFGDNLEAPKGFFGRVRDNLEADGEQLGAAFGRTAEVVIGAGAAAAGILAGASTYVFSKLAGAGETINELTKVGVGFNTTYSELGMSTTQAIGNLGALGVGFEGAAKLISKNSNVVATQGFARFNNTMKYAADVSENLGMSFEDSMESFGDTLSRRQSLINLGNVDQARVNQTVKTTIKTQTAYATALGASTEELAAFVDSLVKDNGLLTASLLGMSDTVKNDVVAGIEVFASGMAAMGGKAGQDIAAAFLEAGSAGAIGLSDAAVGIVTALPQLQGPMNEFVQGIQDGTLSQEDANAMVQNVTKDLANLSDSEKQRIQLMARTGDESAKMMANAIAQFEQSESKLKDINKALGTGFDMDAVQQGTNNFNKILSQIGGGAQNAFYTLFASPEILTVIEDAMKDIMGAFGFGVDSMSGIAQEGGKALGEKFVPMLKKAVTFVTDILKQFAAYVAPFFEEDGGGLGALFADMWDRVTDAAIGMLIKGVAGFAVALFGFSVAKEFAKSILMPQLKGFMGSLFSKESAGKAAGMLKAGGDKLKEVAGPQAGKLMEKVKGSKYGKMASDKLSGIMGKGDAATDKLSGAMTGGGKSGGFLTKIADAVKEFGDNKVVKGAASLALLGTALALTAVGLKTFNEVDIMSIVKGGVVLYGLVEIAKHVGEASTDMLKGAAGIAILGASLIPAAIGLRMFNEVDATSLIKGGIALVGLATIAKSLGNMASSILQGSLAVAALGASIIPMAIGLKLMNSVGAGTIGVLAAGLITLGVAANVLGPMLPIMLAGAVAIAALGASVVPLAVALQLMQGVGIDTVGVLATSLITLGAAAAALGFGLPFILAGAAAIAALGVALMPFAVGALMAGTGTKMLASGMEDLAGIPLADIAGGLLTLGGAMTLMLPLIPGIILTGAALGIAGAAMIPFALGAALAADPAASLANSLVLFNYINAGQLVDIAKGMVALGGAMAVLGLALPLIMLAGLAAEPIQKLGFALFPLSMINFANLLMAGAALESLGSGMSALSGGSLMSSVKDGIGSLFGADSPIDKLRDFISELSKLDITPLLDTAYAFEVLLASSEKLPQFGIMLSIIAEYTEPFIKQMRSLSRSIEKMGEDPFAPFATLGTHAESMTTFATSAEKLNNALNNIDGEYTGSQFYAIGEGIEYMVEQMDRLNIGDMLKVGAMKLFGPSKEEKEEEVRKSAAKNQAKDALYGFDSQEMTGLSEILDKVTSQGSGYRSGQVQAARVLDNLNPAKLSQYGIDIDKSKLNMGSVAPGSRSAEEWAEIEKLRAEEVTRVTQLLKQKVDAFKLQEQTGIDQSVIPVTGRQEQPTPEQQSQRIPGAAETAASNMTPMDEGGPTQIELLTELVRLQAENNRLAKKTKGSIESIEV